MNKTDFKKGQTVFVKCVGNAYRKNGDNVLEAIVKTVGSKYITVSLNSWNDVKFEIDRNFRQVADFSASYVLYLSREDIENDERVAKKQAKLERAFRWETRLVGKMNEQDLDAVIGVIKKYIPDWDND